jgi:hypothetical protein
MAGMRIGLVGPGADAPNELEHALAMLLADASIRHVLYLGDDDAIDGLVAAWSGRGLDDDALLSQAASLAVSGSSEEIAALLEADRAARRPLAVRKLPALPSRAIEMLDRFIVLGVYDKAVLDEDDIASSHIVVYGKSDGPSLRRFGPRSFFTPGPVRAGHVGCLSLEQGGHCEVTIMRLSGNVILRERLPAPSAKVVVTA